MAYLLTDDAGGVKLYVNEMRRSPFCQMLFESTELEFTLIHPLLSCYFTLDCPQTEMHSPDFLPEVRIQLYQLGKTASCKLFNYNMSTCLFAFVCGIRNSDVMQPLHDGSDRKRCLVNAAHSINTVDKSKMSVINVCLSAFASLLNALWVL